MNWKAARLALAALTMPTCAACATSGKPPIARSLPAAPTWLAPVPLPPVVAGADARVVAAQNRAAAAKANRRLVDAGAWYSTIQAQYRGQTP